MERSVLYNIDPIGLGTPYVESLTSYITRLAECHCVQTGSLISKIYAPLLQKEYVSKIATRGGNGFYDSAIGINGIGKLAFEFSELTNKFTGRSDLSGTTLQKWSSILPTRGLLKKSKAWCPECYEEARLRGTVIYEPLIWSFQIVKYCMKHCTQLVDICEHCNSTVPILSRKSTIGFCSRCGKWLGSIPITIEGERDVFDLEADISLVAELLIQDDLGVSKNDMCEAINFYVTEVFNRSPTKAAKYLKIPKSTLMMWLSGDSIPSIQYLVQICKILGVTIIGFLQKQESVRELYSVNSNMKARERYDHEKIKNTLDKVIETKEPLSISAVARIIGCDRKLLSKMYKSECEQIKENYNTLLQEKKAESTSIKLGKLRNAVFLLIEQKIYPSRRRLEKILGTGFLKEKALQDKWNELKRSFDV